MGYESTKGLPKALNTLVKYIQMDLLNYEQYTIKNTKQKHESILCNNLNLAIEYQCLNNFNPNKHCKRNARFCSGTVEVAVTT